MTSKPWSLLTLMLVMHAVDVAAAPASSISMYERAEGQHAGEDPPDPARTIEVSPIEVEFVEVERFDAQYGKKRKFRGVSLSSMIKKYGTTPRADMALLRFTNGMSVPLMLSEIAQLKPFVAYEIKGPRGWTSVFPPIQKAKPGAVDNRPVEFKSNKLVISEAEHPMVPHKAKTFTPWNHTDSLSAIELVNRKAYFRQFEVGGTEEIRKGFAVFKGSCQYCHGARNVGARHGWDFVVPLPVFTYRGDPRSLHAHIYYRAGDAPERGLMMPALRHIDQKHAGYLLSWLKAIAEKEMPAYRIEK